MQIVLMVVVLLTLPSIAHAEDLMAIYQLALERDPQLAAAAAARDMILESIPQAQAGFLPTINASTNLDFNRQKTTYENTLGLNTAADGKTRNFSTHGLALNITQPLYHRETAVAWDQSHLQVTQAEAEYGAAHQTLMVRVAERYFEVLAALDSLETARAEKRAVGRQLEQSKQRFEVGLIAITDVHEAQAGYDLAIAQEISAENQVANTREALREVTGTYPGQLAALSAKIPLIPPDPADLERWSDTAVAHNLNLAAMRGQTEITGKQVEIRRSDLYPRLDAVGRFNIQNSSGGSSSVGAADTDSAMIGLQLSMSLYQGGMLNSRIRQAQSDHLRVVELLEREQRATVLAARKAYLGVIAGISRVKALKQAVISNQSALQATEAGYQVGTRTIVDVLNTQRLLFAAERDYSQARYDYVLNTLRLKQAAGQLSETDLQALNVWLGS